ncbi:MAG: hypothetical protein ACOWWM_12135 [Desulfobacterales bacterium]
MQPKVQVDQLDSIQFLVKIRDRIGNLYLSQVYGSYNKIFEGVEDNPGDIVQCSCPRCHQPFPVLHSCSSCTAPIIGLDLEGGGIIKVCSRNGCKQHSLEFENIDEALNLFHNQDESGLF